MQTLLYARERVCDEKTYHNPLYQSWKVLSGEELVKKCQAGERAALEELIRRYKPMIFNQAYRLTHDSDNAEDVAVETCLHICRRIGTLKSALLLPAWISRILRNTWYDMYRRAQRYPVISLDGLITSKKDEFFNMDEFLFVEVDQKVSPQKCAEENERKSILDQAIAKLSNVQRPLVTLYYGEERTYGEIAEMLRLPIGTVKSRLSRARMALRERLAPQMSYLLD
jgi:RNA polymerase sigma-70 factor, ECF subfamily